MLLYSNLCSIFFIHNYQKLNFRILSPPPLECLIINSLSETQDVYGTKEVLKCLNEYMKFPLISVSEAVVNVLQHSMSKMGEGTQLGK